MTKIKICGLCRERDIAFVNQYLPDYAGFVINSPKNFRSLSPEKAAILIRLLNPGIPAVGIIADQPVEFAAELLNSGGVNILQLNGSEDNAYINSLKQQCSGEIWKYVSISSLNDAANAAQSAADLLVIHIPVSDSGLPDTSLLAALDRPYLLSGLSSGNAVKSVKLAKPYGIDLSEGVERNNIKDKGKISSVIASVRGIKI